MVSVFVHTGYEGNNLCKNICIACYLHTRINHNGKRICLLFIYEFVHGTKKFENNCPFVIANQNKNL